MRLFVAGLVLLTLVLRLLWQANLPTPIDLNLIDTVAGVALLLVALKGS